MELHKFVENTLSQILQGISAAQTGVLGGNVAAQMNGQPSGANIYNSGDAGTFTVIDFDIAVKAVDEEGGHSIQVGEVEGHAGGLKSNENINRVKFSVHMKLPSGDAAPTARYYPTRVNRSIV